MRIPKEVHKDLILTLCIILYANIRKNYLNGETSDSLIPLDFALCLFFNLYMNQRIRSHYQAINPDNNVRTLVRFSAMYTTEEQQQNNHSEANNLSERNEELRSLPDQQQQRSNLT